MGYSEPLVVSSNVEPFDDGLQRHVGLLPDSIRGVIEEEKKHSPFRSPFDTPRLPSDRVRCLS